MRGLCAEEALCGAGGKRGAVCRENDARGRLGPLAGIADAGIGADRANDGIAAHACAGGSFDEVVERGKHVFAAGGDESVGAGVAVDGAVVVNLILAGDFPDVVPVEIFLLDGFAIGVVTDGAGGAVAAEEGFCDFFRVKCGHFRVTP